MSTTNALSWQKCRAMLKAEIEKVEGMDALELVDGYTAVEPVKKALEETLEALERAKFFVNEVGDEFEEASFEVSHRDIFERVISITRSEGTAKMTRCADALQVILDGDLLG